jgi:FkbM family methyltransferase
MRVIKEILINITDVRSFGPQILKRHISRIFGRSATLEIPEVGPIHVRLGESDLETVRQVFKEKQYDMALPWIRAEVNNRILNRYSKILESGKIPVIADAGANIGSATLWFKKEYPKSYVVAVEPEPGNVNVLRQNVANLPSVSVFEAAIGSESGFVSIESKGLAWAAQTARTGSGIPIVTMKDVFSSVPSGCPFIAKIDIEGFESDLFSKNLEWLNDVYVIYIEPHDFMLPGMTSRTFQRAIASHEFELFIRGENLVYVRA